MDYITINGKRYPVSDFRFPTKPKANADRIRAMTDDMQLAIFFASVSGCPYDREIALDKCESWSNACVSCWLDWLKQEASE